MKYESTGTLLRIFVDENDRHGGSPLYMAIIEAVHAAGFIGATVLKGIEGYGLHKAVHSARVFDISTDLPIVVEVIDESEKISSFLPTLREMIPEGLLTLANVHLIRMSRDER